MLRRNGFLVVCLVVCLMAKTATAQEIGFAKVPELKAPEAGPVIRPGTAVAAPVVPALSPASNIGRRPTAQEMSAISRGGNDALNLISVVERQGGIVVPPSVPAKAPRAMIGAAGVSLDAANVTAGLSRGVDGLNATERDGFYDSSSRLGGCVAGIVVGRSIGACETGSAVVSAMRDGQVLITDYSLERGISAVSTVVSFTGPVGQAFAAGTTIGDIVERRTGAGGKFGVWSYDTVDTLQDTGWLPGTSDAQKMAIAERRQQLKSDAMLREMRLRTYVEASAAYSSSPSPDTAASAGPAFFDGFIMALGAAAQASANSSQAYAGSSVSTGAAASSQPDAPVSGAGAPRTWVIHQRAEPPETAYPSTGSCRPSVPGGGIDYPGWCEER